MRYTARGPDDAPDAAERFELIHELREYEGRQAGDRKVTWGGLRAADGHLLSWWDIPVPLLRSLVKFLEEDP